MRRATFWTLALGLALAACGGGPEGEGTAADAELAPDFTLPSLAGESVQLSALRGKTVVLDFWATWCPPCEFQIPILNEVHDALAGEDVEIIGIAIDAEGRDVVAPYAAKHDVRYPTLLGDEDLARRFNAPGFPFLIVVTPDGRVDRMHVGLIEREELEAAIAEVVPAAAEAPPA